MSGKTFSILAFLLPLAAAAQVYWPEVVEYPYEEPARVQADAQVFSDRLEAFIREWAAGDRAPTRVSDSLMSNFNHELQVGVLTIVDPDRPNPQRRWGIRHARPIDFDSLVSGYPDANATYLLAPLLAPFGAKLYMEGEFPLCRFFNVQISPPLDPRFFVLGRYNGSPEITIVDKDIEPDPGHTNPFKTGANRKAENRGYHLTFEMAMGDALELNPGYEPPAFATPGNTRVGSGFQYQGPWGLEDTSGLFRTPRFPYPAPGGGKWDYGFLWVRYYAMDKGIDALGGVELPKLYFELKTGERFWMQVNLDTWEPTVNKSGPAPLTDPVEPKALEGPHVGWKKQFGVSLNGYEEFYRAWNWTSPEARAHIREVELGMTGRGENQPSLGSFEGSATLCTFNTFMGRGMSLGDRNIMVMTGRLPTFPNTRSGAATMTGGQLRYWSITTYNGDIFSELPSTAISSVMDDEVIIDEERRYVIVWSRPDERPSNAVAEAGVTWVNWGPTSHQGMIWRWMSVEDEWSMPDTTPNEINLPRRTASWSGTEYDSTLIGLNTHHGALGMYQPRIHYLTVEEFEALGETVSIDKVPLWWNDSSSSALPLHSVARTSGLTVWYDRRSNNLIVNTQNGADMVVKLFSVNGRLIRKIDVPAGPGLKEFRVGTEFLNSGCYLAEISLTNGITPAVKQRFVK